MTGIILPSQFRWRLASFDSLRGVDSRTGLSTWSLSGEVFYAKVKNRGCKERSSCLLLLKLRVKFNINSTTYVIHKKEKVIKFTSINYHNRPSYYIPVAFRECFIFTFVDFPKLKWDWNVKINKCGQYEDIKFTICKISRNQYFEKK